MYSASIIYYGKRGLSCDERDPVCVPLSRAEITATKGARKPNGLRAVAEGPYIKCLCGGMRSLLDYDSSLICTMTFGAFELAQV